MTTEETKPHTERLPISTHTEMLPVCKFYVNEALTKYDVQKNESLNIYSSRSIRTISTMTQFNLSKADVRAIVFSSVERYPDETYDNYKIRLKTRDGFTSVYKRFATIEKSQVKQLG